MTSVEPVLAEEPIYFEVDGERLFGVLHLPANQPRSALVFCHALAEEKLWSHRVYVNFAREAARRGHAVLRFDMRGEGDSDREFGDCSITTRVADAGEALVLLRRRAAVGAERMFFVGHRLGGTVGALTCVSRRNLMKGLVIWDPIELPEDYFMQLLRLNLGAQMAIHGKVVRTREDLLSDIQAGVDVNVEGYPLTLPLYREVMASNLGESISAAGVPVLMLDVRPADQAGSGGNLPARCERVTVEEQPFWRETRLFHQRASGFTEETLRWIESQCA